eukprot:COSAG02_NODE_8586_length_2513_cov_1.447390_1_plen_126_part_00
MAKANADECASKPSYSPRVRDCSSSQQNSRNLLRSGWFGEAEDCITHQGFVASGGGGGGGGSGGGAGGGVLLWQFPGTGGVQFAGALCEHCDQQRESVPNDAGNGNSSASATQQQCRIAQESGNK